MEENFYNGRNNLKCEKCRIYVAGHGEIDFSFNPDCTILELRHSISKIIRRKIDKTFLLLDEKPLIEGLVRDLDLKKAQIVVSKEPVFFPESILQELKSNEKDLEFFKKIEENFEQSSSEERLTEAYGNKELRKLFQEDLEEAINSTSKSSTCSICRKKGTSQKICLIHLKQICADCSCIECLECQNTICCKCAMKIPSTCSQDKSFSCPVYNTLSKYCEQEFPQIGYSKVVHRLLKESIFSSKKESKNEKRNPLLISSQQEDPILQANLAMKSFSIKSNDKDEDYFKIISLSGDKLKQEAEKEKIFTPIPLSPTMTKKEEEIHCISEVFRQSRLIIDFSKLEHVNEALLEFSKQLPFFGLFGKYYYTLKLGMNYDKMKEVMEEKEVSRQIKERLSRALNVPTSWIKDLQLNRGCLEIVFSVQDPSGNKVDPLRKDDINKMRAELPQLIQVEVSSTSSDKKEIAKLLDSDYDEDFTSLTTREEKKKGGMSYFTPVGWVGRGLNVKGKYENDEWLTRGPNEWAVGFHGTKYKFMNSIITEGLKPGSGQGYNNVLDCNPISDNKGKVCGIGVYFSYDINVADGYCDNYSVATSNGTKNVRVVFQCRLNPSKIRIPETWKNAYIVNETKDIRAYRIMLKANQFASKFFRVLQSIGSSDGYEIKQFFYIKEETVGIQSVVDEGRLCLIFLDQNKDLRSLYFSTLNCDYFDKRLFCSKKVFAKNL